MRMRGVELDVDRRRRLLAERASGARSTCISRHGRIESSTARCCRCSPRRCRRPGARGRRCRATTRASACCLARTGLQHQQQAERAAVAGAPCRSTARHQSSPPHSTTTALAGTPVAATFGRRRPTAGATQSRWRRSSRRRRRRPRARTPRTSAPPARRRSSALGSQRRSSGRRRRISATSCSIVTAASTSSATHWRRADPGRRGRAPMFLSSATIGARTSEWQPAQAHVVHVAESIAVADGRRCRCS